MMRDSIGINPLFPFLLCTRAFLIKIVLLFNFDFSFFFKSDIKKKNKYVYSSPILAPFFGAKNDGLFPNHILIVVET